MKSIRKTAAVILAFVLIISLAACKGSNTPAPADTKSPGQAVSEPDGSNAPSGSDKPARNPSDVKLTYTFWGSTYEKDVKPQKV